MGQNGGATQGLPGEGSRAGKRNTHAAAVLPTAGRLPGMAMHALGSVGCPCVPWCVHPPQGAEATELHGTRLSINVPQPGSLLQHHHQPIVLRNSACSQGKLGAGDGGDRDGDTWLKMGKAPQGISIPDPGVRLLVAQE